VRKGAQAGAARRLPRTVRWQKIAAMVPDPASPQIGAISRYVVLRELGSGAMGVVFAAYDPDLDRKVAIKVLRAGRHEGSTGADHMRREAQAMARLSHPNVAQIYEVGEHAGRMYLAMEFIDGVTVRTWLERQPRHWRDVVRVYVEAGRGLAAAHAAGLVHRDFKPKTRSPLGRPPDSPSGRILNVRGVSRRGPWRVVPPDAAVLATGWQSRRAVPSGGARRLAASNFRASHESASHHGGPSSMSTSDSSLCIVLDSYNLEAAEHLLCIKALETAGNIVSAATLLGVTRHALKRRIIKHKIDWPRRS
jgi:serine/threonine protein kinase